MLDFAVNSALLHPEDGNSSLWCRTRRAFCLHPPNYVRRPQCQQPWNEWNRNRLNVHVYNSQTWRTAHECELRVQTICSVLPWIVFSGSGSISPRLLRMCEFNYLSGDYLCGDCHFQSVLDAKHNTARAGVALSVHGERSVALSGKCLSTSSRGAKGKSSQAWILNDPGLTLVHLQICAWPRSSRKEVSCIIYRKLSGCNGIDAGFVRRLQRCRDLFWFRTSVKIHPFLSGKETDLRILRGGCEITVRCDTV